MQKGLCEVKSNTLIDFKKIFLNQCDVTADQPTGQFLLHIGETRADADGHPFGSKSPRLRGFFRVIDCF
jgi:hypothetical protein